jgi:hypothetical protein
MENDTWTVTGTFAQQNGLGHDVSAGQTEGSSARARQSARPGRLAIPEQNTYGVEEQDYARIEEVLPIAEVEAAMSVSIGHEQTRLLSPSTPAAEKSAALDKTNSWGFFADGTDDDQEEVLRNTIQNSIPPEPQVDEAESDRESDIDMHDRIQASTGTRSDLPSPWRAGPKLFTPREQSQLPRSRATSANILGEGTIKRFLSSLSFPLLQDVKQTLPGRKADESITRGTGQTRHGRSASVLSYKLPWPGGQSSGARAKARDMSPGLTNRQISMPSNVQHESYQPIRNGKGHDVSDQGEPGNAPRSSLVRSRSDESLAHRSMSRASTLEDLANFDHVSGQVNSRMKAIKESLSDSLPSLPSINFEALRPDFPLRKAGDGDRRGPTAMGYVFGSGGVGNRARSDSGGSNPSPRRLTFPKYPVLEEALDSLTGDVVVMGGYRGSILRSAEAPYRQLWVPVKVGLNIRKVNLEVGLDPEDEDNMHTSIFASEMLTHIGPVDMGRRLLTKLRNCRNAKEGKLRVHEYGYDWRLSPHMLSRRLIRFLERLECNSTGTPEGDRGATVIAHSLGGLITRHAVNQRPYLFKGLLYAGVPQHCVNILGPLRNGDEVLLSSKVLTAQVNFTFRTSFLLLPDSGQCYIDMDTNQQYHVDFFDPETWSRYALSPCIAPCLPPLHPPPERKSILGTLSDNFQNYRSTALSSLSLTKTDSSPERPITEEAKTKADDILNPEDHTLNMSMDAPPHPNNAVTIPLPEAKAYLKRTLAEVLTFRKELAHNSKHQSRNAYPPISLMYSTSTPTVYGARVSGREGIRHADAYDNLAFAAGDGVVLARAAMVPRGYKVVEGGRVRTERGHVGMLGDLEGVGKCLLATSKARTAGVGLGRERAGTETLNNATPWVPDILATPREGSRGDGHGDGSFF